MGDSWTIIETKREPVTTKALELRIANVLDAFGQIGVMEIRTGVWAVSRFKRPTGKSTAGWRHLVRTKGAGLVIYNPVVNKYGTNYPRFVHLAGRTERLMLEVERYGAKDLAPRIARAVAFAHIEAARGMPKTTKRTKIGG